MLNRTQAPTFGAIDYPELLKPTTHTLSSGLKLYTIKVGDQPVIKFELILKTSIWQENQPGLSWFTAKMLSEGSSNKSANDIAAIFDFHGAYLEVNPGFDSTTISLYCLKKHFKQTLSLFHEVITSPSFPQKELDTLINMKKQQIMLNKGKNNIIAAQNIRLALYGNNHPYGRTFKESDLKSITPELLKNNFENNFLNISEMYLCGDIDEQEISEVESFFGGFSAAPSARVNSNFTTNQSNNISTDKPKSMQSALNLGWHIPNKKHSDHFKLLITNEILGGYFGSRLMKNLREEKGLTYGINSYPIYLIQASFLLISTEVIADKTQLAIDEILKEIDLLKTKKVSQEELNTVTNYMAGTFLSKVSSPFSLIDKFQSVHHHGLDYDYYKSYFQTLNTITPQDIMSCANEYFNLDKMSVSVVGKV